MSKPDYVLKWGAEADPSIDAAFKEIVAKAKAAGASVGKSMNEGVGRPAWLESLKGGFGRESAVGGVGEILKGGGAIIGITAAAEAIKGLAEGAQKVKADFYDSDKNAADMAQDLLKSVPVLGSIEEAGAAVNEAFTGQEASLKRVTDEAADLSKELIVHKELIKEGADYYRDVEDSIDRIKAKTAEIGAPQFQAQQDATRESGKEQNKSSAQKAKDEVKKLTDDAKPAIEKLRTQINEEQNRIAQGFRTTTVDPETGAPIPGAEDEDAKREALNRLAQLQNRKSALERNRDNQINKVQSGAKDEQSATDDLTKKQLAQQRKEHNATLKDESDQSALDAKVARSEQYQEQLELQGRFYDAQLYGIKIGEGKAIEELRLATDKRERGLVKGSKEWLQVEQEYEDKKSAITSKSQLDQTKVKQQNINDFANEKSSHQMKSESKDAGTIENYLKASGQTRAASEFEIGFKHYQAQQEIQSDLQHKLRDHPEHADEYKRQAVQDTNADKLDAAMDLKSQEAERDRESRPHIDEHIPGGETRLLTGDKGELGVAADTQAPNPSTAAMGQLVGINTQQYQLMGDIKSILYELSRHRLILKAME